MKVLFTSIGGSDPIKRMHDGPMLHCLRVYKPDIVYIYFTKTMLDYEKKDNRYTWAIGKLGEHLGHKFEIKFIERPELTDVHIFDNFYEDFDNIFDEIFRLHPYAEIYANVSSGTPAIKSAIMVCSAMAKRTVNVVQISSGETTPVHDREKDTDYDKEIQWECNMDNSDEFKNRSSIIESDQFLTKVKKENILKYVSVFDYQAALTMAEEIKKYITDESLALIRAAAARSRLDYNGVVNALNGREHNIIPVKDNKKRPITEYLLWLGITMEKGDYLSFIRGITPAAMTLMETATEKYTPVGDIKKYCIKNNDHCFLSTSKMQEDETGRSMLDILTNRFSNFKECEYTTVHLDALIQNMCTDEKIRSYAAIIRKAERDLRNQAAHTIIAVGDELIERRIGMTAANLYDIIKKMAERVGLVQKNTWNSYAEMNKLITDKLYEIRKI